MPFDLLEQIETDLLAAGSADVIALPALAEPQVEAPGPAPAPPAELMSLQEFSALYWGMGHHALGASLSARIGAEVPLFEQATSADGMKACEALYDLLKSTPSVARYVLAKEFGAMDRFMPLVLHGVACWKLVQSARKQAVIEARADPAPEFRTTRATQQHHHPESDLS